MQIEPYRAKLEFDFVDRTFLFFSIKSPTMNTT